MYILKLCASVPAMEPILLSDKIMKPLLIKVSQMQWIIIRLQHLIHVI